MDKQSHPFRFGQPDSIGNRLDYSAPFTETQRARSGGPGSGLVVLNAITLAIGAFEAFFILTVHDGYARIPRAGLAFIGIFVQGTITAISLSVRPKDWLLFVGSFLVQAINMALVLTLPTSGGGC